MRVAPGKQACASRRAHRGDVEIRIPHPTSRKPVHTRGGNFGSVAAEVGKTHVVENDDYDIGRPFGGGQLVRPPGLGILICPPDGAFEEIFVMRHAASLLEAADIASAAHRRSTAQVHAACSRVPIASRTSNRAIQVSCCINVADRPKNLFAGLRSISTWLIETGNAISGTYILPMIRRRHASFTSTAAIGRTAARSLRRCVFAAGLLCVRAFCSALLVLQASDACPGALQIIAHCDVQRAAALTG